MGALDDAGLRSVHESWRPPGIGSSFFTKWFAFAGAVPGRAWQPLILDARVVSALDVFSECVPAGPDDRRGSAARYAAYVRVMREWAKELAISAERLEWVLLVQKGRNDSVEQRWRGGPHALCFWAQDEPMVRAVTVLSRARASSR
jgi:hypothetical protein